MAFICILTGISLCYDFRIKPKGKCQIGKEGIFQCREEFPATRLVLRFVDNIITTFQIIQSAGQKEHEQNFLFPTTFFDNALIEFYY